MANALKINVSATWKDVDVPWINVSGTWKTPDKVWINVSGTWKEIWTSGPSVVIAPTKTISNIAFFGGDCTAGVRVNSDGDLYASSETGSYSGGNYETWLDSGLNTEVWVQRTIISGTLTVDAGTARLLCSTSRTFSITTTFFKQTVIDLKFYDAAAGGNLLDTQRVTLIADYDSDL